MFKAMIEGPWPESCGTAEEPQEVRLGFLCNADAALIVLKMMHGRYERFIEKPSLDLLVDTALVADYFTCCDLLEVYSQRLGLDTLTTSSAVCAPSVAAMDKILMVSLAFRHDVLFQNITRRIIRYSCRPLQTALPIPRALIDDLEERRADLVAFLAEPLTDLLDRLRTGRICDVKCDHMTMQILLQRLPQLRIIDGAISVPKLGTCPDDVIAVIKQTMPTMMSYYTRRHSCHCGKSLMDYGYGVNLEEKARGESGFALTGDGSWTLGEPLSSDGDNDFQSAKFGNA
jgi:hypothetical protein